MCVFFFSSANKKKWRNLRKKYPTCFLFHAFDLDLISQTPVSADAFSSDLTAL